MIINTIQERGYVKKCDIPGEMIQFNEHKLFGKNIEKITKEKLFGNEKNKLLIQPTGILTIEFLIEHFDHIFSYEYTREMEEQLDKIANKNPNDDSDNEPWYAICQKCKDEIKELSKPLYKLKKKSYKINDEYDLVFHQFGASLRKFLDNGEIEYKNVKKNLKIDLIKLNNGDYTFDELVEIKNDYLGKYQDHDMYLKNGKFGPYVVWGDNRKSIKNINKDLNDITLNDIITYIDENNQNPIHPDDKPRAPPQIANKNILRVLNSDISIRKGKFGPYIFYQTSSMQKPAFFGIGKYKKNYNSCNPETFLEWIVSTYINK